MPSARISNYASSDSPANASLGSVLSAADQYSRFFLCGRPVRTTYCESGIATLRRKGGYLYRPAAMKWIHQRNAGSIHRVLVSNDARRRGPALRESARVHQRVE